MLLQSAARCSQDTRTATCKHEELVILFSCCVQDGAHLPCVLHLALLTHMQ
jgi:hypothetical protein